MPNAFLLTFRRLNDAPLPANTGDVVHAAFYDLIARGDAALTERLHNANARKPFTICLKPLHPHASRSQSRPPNHKSPATDCALRITLLDEELFAPFVDGVAPPAPPLSLRLGSALYAPDALLTTSTLHSEAGSASFAELWTQTLPADALTLRFVTPTAFRSHDRDVLSPDPRFMWQSWARAWNAYAPADVPKIAEDALLASAQRIYLDTYDLHTRKARLKGVPQSGFVGVCRFDLSELTSEERHIASVLAAFAFYAGTGRKTGMGMGQTRVGE